MYASFAEWLAKSHAIPLGFDRELMLTFRWTALITPVAVLLILWLYHYELRIVRWFAALPLLVLRLSILFVVLSLVGLEPVFIHTITEELPGRVLIVVDRSDSTAVADPQRPAVDKLRLARALKFVDDLCPNDQIDDWIKQLDEKKEIAWPVEEEHKLYDQVIARLDAMTRAEASR